MKRIFLLCPVLTSLIITSSWATIINVPGQYATIQAGIDASIDGDTVLVAPGVYYENINYNGHNIVVGSQFITTRDTAYIGSTIIDGNGVGTPIRINHGENLEAKLIGLTIFNGHGIYGGGVFCENSSPTIEYNLIRSNVAYYCEHMNQVGYGGGIYLEHSSSMICNNVITENFSVWGGAIFVEQSTSAVIQNNIIRQNNTQTGVMGGAGAGIYLHDSINCLVKGNTINQNYGNGSGAGINCDGSSANISFNTIVNNQANRGDGGGISCWSSNGLVSNNVIAGNKTGIFGHAGGIYVSNSNIRIINCTLYGNTAFQGGAVFCAAGSQLVIINSLLWADSAGTNHEIGIDSTSTPQVLYSNIENILMPGEGNICVSPGFRNPSSGDFHLIYSGCGDLYNSPCIDAGHPGIHDTTLACTWGMGTYRSDMGAYGGGNLEEVGIEDWISLLPKWLSLSQNYPNPFNPATTIAYELPSACRVRLEVFDLLGRRVATLEDGERPAGHHQAVWNARDVSSGIYFYRLIAGEETEIKKMTLLK